MKTSIKITILFFVCLNFVGCKPDQGITVETLPSNVITKISIDKNGVKWIATSKGLVSFDGKNWTSYSKISSLYNQPTLDVILNETSSEKSFFASTNEGVIKGSFVNQSVSQSQTYRQVTTGLICDTVTKMTLNYINTVFLGTPKGLSILKDATWTSFDGHWGSQSNDNFLTTEKISGIAAAKNGWVYVTTKGGGVSCFKFVDAVTSATKYVQPWASGLRSDVVYTVVIVDDTCQWYGTDKGASYHTSRYTKKGWDLNYYATDGLASDSVYAIAKDATGNVWFGTERGVSMLKDNAFTSYTTKDGLINNKINTLAIDIDGSVWFGTNTGISHLKDGKWSSYSKN